MKVDVSEMDFGKKSCNTCLFCVDSMPDVIICIAGKKIKEYVRMKMNCEKWVEDTTENAKEQLKRIKQQKD
jgi:hypothetical protein